MSLENQQKNWKISRALSEFELKFEIFEIM